MSTKGEDTKNMLKNQNSINCRLDSLIFYGNLQDDMVIIINSERSCENKTFQPQHLRVITATGLIMEVWRFDYYYFIKPANTGISNPVAVKMNPLTFLWGGRLLLSGFFCRKPLKIFIVEN